MTATMLIIAGRSAVVRHRACLLAAPLVLIAGIGTAWGRLVPLWPLTALDSGSAGPVLSAFAPHIAGALIVMVAAMLLAVGLRRQGTAEEMAVGGVLSWGAVTLARLLGAPGGWGSLARETLDRQEAATVARTALAFASCLAVAAALVLVAVLWAAPASREQLIARCRGACAVVAVLLLSDATAGLTNLTEAWRVESEPFWWAAPHAALLLGAAAALGLAAARWSLAPVLVLAAAAAAAGSVALAARADSEWLAAILPAPAVTGLAGPIALTACVLLVLRVRDRQKTSEPVSA